MFKIWIVPTTINTLGLNTDQKRENIREEQMAEFRRLYDKLGIGEAVDLVLDGTVFTQDRVKESYDGVHYPLQVYDGGAQILLNAIDLFFQHQASRSRNRHRSQSLWLSFLVLGVTLRLIKQEDKIQEMDLVEERDATAKDTTAEG